MGEGLGKLLPVNVLAKQLYKSLKTEVDAKTKKANPRGKGNEPEHRRAGEPMKEARQHRHHHIPE
ncbi:hypothetical protein D3C76_1366590 [compost metagenome]